MTSAAVHCSAALRALSALRLLYSRRAEAYPAHAPRGPMVLLTNQVGAVSARLGSAWLIATPETLHRGLETLSPDLAVVVTFRRR